MFFAFLCAMCVLLLLGRKVVEVILVGIIFGSLLHNAFNPLETFSYLFHKILGVFYGINGVKWNILFLFLFLLSLGVLSHILIYNKANQSFEEWIKLRIKNKKSAELLIFCMGIFIFVNGYLSAMIAGSIAKPLGKTYKISKERMAYIIDSTSAPICAIVPLSSWGAYILGILSASLQENVMHIFFSSMMLNFYSWFALLCVFLSLIFNLHLSKEEYFFQQEEQKYQSKATWKPLILPLLGLIGIAIFGIVCFGYSSSASNTPLNLLSRSNFFLALWLGSLGGIVFALIFSKHKIKIFFLSFNNGCKEIFPLICLLVLAWIMGSIFKEDLKLGVDFSHFLTQTFSNHWVLFLPLALFVASAFLSVITGSGGASLVLNIPLCVELSLQNGGDLLLGLACVISGSVLGDHLSLVSDTTILASTSLKLPVKRHFVSQLPYVILSALFAFFAFLLCVFGISYWVSFLMSCIVFVLVLFLLKKQ